MYNESSKNHTKQSDHNCKSCSFCGTSDPVNQKKKNCETASASSAGKKPGKKVVKDHLGNVYPDLKSMCAAYNIPRGVFQYRINAGKTLEEALTEKIHKSIITENKKVIKDHLGNEYPSVSAMCEAYGVPLTNFLTRIRRKWPLEKALSAKKTSSVVYKGVLYNSLADLCAAHGISLSTYRNRIKQGMTMEEALSKKPFYDHLGNGYDSLGDMLKAYGLKEATYRYRRKNGWSLQDILTADRNTRHDGARLCYVTDHLGRQYKSAIEMCKAHNVRYGTYLIRKRQGLSMAECLSGQRRKSKQKS